MRRSYYSRIGKWPGKIALIWGEKDLIIHSSATDPFLKLRKDTPTEFILIPDGGHLPHQEKPAETAEAILAFLQSRQAR